MKKKVKSLSSKIVFLIAVVALLSTFLIFYLFEKINKEAYYTVEMEKAQLVLSTIEPLIAVNIYLNLNDRIDQLTQQLITNPNILAVKVLQNDQVYAELLSKPDRNRLRLLL